MGQYFTATVTKGNNTTCYDAWSNDNGAKLTEHSWIGNRFVDGVARKIYNRKARLVWAGDYANDVMKQVKSFDGTVCKFTPDELYEGKHSYKDEKTGEWHAKKLDGLKTGGHIKRVDFDYKNKYFINISRKEYIDMNRYIAKSTMTEEDWQDWCQNPVSLLTAIGNGQGGGDYNTNAINANLVGRWAFDEVIIKDKAPSSDYKLLDIIFNERIEGKLPHKLI